MKPRLFVTAAVAALAAAPVSWSQPTATARLTPDAAPGATVTLRAGFQPDPHTLDVQAGGTIAAAEVQPECNAGYVAAAPTVRLDYTAAQGQALNIFAASAADTTLAVNTPDGRWLCNDDGQASLNPEILIAQPRSGAYRIWVGRFGIGGEEGADTPETAPASLRFSATERAPHQPSVPIPPPAPRTPPPNADLGPTQGTLTLRGGFAPDPRTLPVQAGGGTDTQGIEGCNGGFVSPAPAVRLDYTAGSGPLVISAASQADTTLAIRAPDGSWSCNDDGALTLDPMVTFERPASGRYDIFVGRFGTQGANAPATLRVSATPPPPPADLPAEALEEAAAPVGVRRVPSHALRPTYGALVLRTGFKPDPAIVAVHAGGDRDASAIGEACYGYLPDAPSVRLTFTAGRHPLSVSIRAQGDTVLAIRGPDGRFTCNDDSEGLNPRVTYQRPRTGRYDIFVGTFGGPPNAAPPAAILRVSEMVDQPETPGAAAAN